MGAIHRKQMAAVRKAHLFVGQMEASYTFQILFMLCCGFPTGIDGGGTVHPGFFRFCSECSILPPDLWELFELKIEVEEQSKKCEPLIPRT